MGQLGKRKGGLEAEARVTMGGQTKRLFATAIADHPMKIINGVEFGHTGEAVLTIRNGGVSLGILYMSAGADLGWQYYSPSVGAQTYGGGGWSATVEVNDTGERFKLLQST